MTSGAGAARRRLLLAAFEAVDALLDLGELGGGLGLRLLGAVEPLGELAELRAGVALGVGDAGLERRKLAAELRHAGLQRAGWRRPRRAAETVSRSRLEVAAAPAMAPSASGECDGGGERRIRRQAPARSLLRRGRLGRGAVVGGGGAHRLEVDDRRCRSRRRSSALRSAAGRRLQALHPPLVRRCRWPWLSVPVDGFTNR